MIETYRGVAYPHQMDHMGHMNVQWYTAKFDEATWQFLAMLGITNDYIRTTHKGMAALEQRTKYKAEVMAGDVLLVKTQAVEMTEKVIRFTHVMFNAQTGQEVASNEAIGVHFDRQNRKSCPFPEAIRAQWACLAAQEAE